MARSRDWWKAKVFSVGFCRVGTRAHVGITVQVVWPENQEGRMVEVAVGGPEEARSMIASLERGIATWILEEEKSARQNG